jgi:hypothetical protein
MCRVYKRYLPRERSSTYYIYIEKVPKAKRYVGVFGYKLDFDSISNEH